jgi:hypothetical protein
MPFVELVKILTSALMAAGGAVGILEILHRIQTRQSLAIAQHNATGILNALESDQQRGTVVQMQDFIGGRVNGPITTQRQESPYGTLIGSTGQNRRSLAG